MNKMMQPTGIRATHCANCGTPLQGEWCHACGQSSRHMLRHLPEMVEDAAELLFHLNGRVMKTLPTLYFFPGRLTREYMAGRRVRYVTPFRLMFVLCLLSFFFLHVSLNVGTGRRPEQADTSTFAAAQTPEAVLQRLDALHAQMDTAGQAPDETQGLEDVMKLSRGALDAAALQRLRQVLPGHAPTPAQAARIDTLIGETLSGAESTASLQRRLATALAVADAIASPDADRARQRQLVQQQAGARLAFLHAQQSGTSTADRNAPATPAAGVQGWFRRHVQRIEANLARLSGSDADRELLVGHIFSTLPQAMLVLVPVFALLLQLLYLFQHRLYMEHLIVSLHSHAFLFLSLLILIGLGALGGVLPGWAAVPVGWLRMAAWLWIPIYLLLMQKRVYGQGWGWTVFKYAVTGTVYLFMLMATLAAATLIGLAG